MNYQVVTAAGKLVTFDTDLSIEQAQEIVATLPASGFIDWILAGFYAGNPSHKQQMWALKTAQDTLNARKPAEPAPKAPNTVGPFLGLVTLIAKMQEKAKRQVILRFEGATVKAVTKGYNAGAAYVYQNGAYTGKISRTGTFDGGANVAEVLAQVANDPKNAAVAYGRKTGTCSCCGRGLVDPVSVFGGIGPICLAKMAGEGARAELEEDFRDFQAANLLDAILAA